MYDTGQVQTLVSTGVLNLMKDSFSVIALVSLMFYQNWKLALFAILMMPLAGGLARTLGRRIGKATSEAGESSGRLISFLSEILKGSKMIKIYQKEDEENAKANDVINDLVEKNIKIGSIMVRATPIMEALTGFMIAGFIFLRLRGILGKRTGSEGKAPDQFKEVLKNIKIEPQKKSNNIFDEQAQKEFIKGAKIAYETIITDFSDNDNKITNSKPLLDNEVYKQFSEALKERDSRGHYAEITFIGVNKAEIKEHKKSGNILNVTVNFIGEVITCIRDKDKKIISGDPEKIKKIYDTWVFSRDTTSQNPNWQLVSILT